MAWFLLHPRWNARPGSIVQFIGDTHVAQADIGLQAPLPVLAGAEGDARLDAIVETIELLFPVARVSRIGIDVVFVLGKELNIRSQADDDLVFADRDMIPQYAEGVGGRHHIDIAPDGEHSQQAGCLYACAHSRHQ